LDLTAVFSMMEQNRIDLLETINPVTTIVEGLTARIDELEGKCKAQFVALDQDFDAQDTRVSRYRLILNEAVKTVILATLLLFQVARTSRSSREGWTRFKVASAIVGTIGLRLRLRRRCCLTPMR
jgi:hypothetical protein